MNEKSETAAPTDAGSAVKASAKTEEAPSPSTSAGSVASEPSPAGPSLFERVIGLFRQRNGTSLREEIADALAETERSRLSGLGFEFGAGVTYSLAPGLHLGGRYQLEYYRSLAAENEGDTITSWLHGSAGILLEFQGITTQDPQKEE